MSNNNDEESKDCTFDVVLDKCELGKTYPLYGMITSILSESPNVTVILNHDIKLTLLLNQEEPDRTNKLNTLKDRVFEPGIFITTITNIHKDNNNPYPIEGEVITVIFGRKQMTEYDA